MRIKILDSASSLAENYKMNFGLMKIGSRVELCPVCLNFFRAYHI